VDPHIKAEQSGLSPESPNEEERANYLRRLKGQASEGAPSTPAATSSIVLPATAGSPGFKERRRSPRFQCSGSAEFWPEDSNVRMWGTLTDVSLHGCYIEMNNTFPLGTRMRLTLEALDIKVRVQGTVRVSYPSLGMGICFSQIGPLQQLQLERLLAALSGQSSPSDSGSNPGASSTQSLADVDSKTMLDELTEFFRSNQLLSRKEFYQIAQRARR